MRNPFRDGVFPEVTAELSPGFGGQAAAAMAAILEEYHRRLRVARREEASPGERPDPVGPYDWDGIIASVAAAHGLAWTGHPSVAERVERYAAAPGAYIAFVHPTVPVALERLRAEGHRLVVATNGLWIYQEPVLRALGISGLFDRATAPDLTGVAKPQAEAFYAAVGEERAPAAVHVGDDLLFDVAAARHAGLRAIWVIPPRLARDPSIRRLAPWDRPQAIVQLAAWQSELDEVRHRRPAADRRLAPHALPDAAVLHVGEVPAVIAHWQEQASGPLRAQPRTAGRRAARWEVPVLELPAIGEALVRWFDRAARPMPWRARRDAYAIMVSEFMLQQTRVQTALAYFERFMRRFPTLEALAQAPLDDVLAEWQGLGYYRRAVQLHEAARSVVERFGGRIPDDPAVLRTLPGIGPYVAGAIASIAYGRPVPAIDGNASRVLSRLLLERDRRSQAGATRLALWAAGMIPEGRAAAFTQALMELGSTVCRPHPDCSRCPLQRLCSAWAYRLQEEVPERRPVSNVRVADVAAALVVDGTGRMLLVRRPAGGLLGGMWGPPCGELGEGETSEQAALRIASEQGGIVPVLAADEPAATVEHVFSHRRWRIRAYWVRPLSPPVTAALEDGAPWGTGGANRPEKGKDGPALERAWASPQELQELPIPRAFRKVIDAATGAVSPRARRSVR